MIQKCSELRSFRHGKDKISLLYNLGVNLWGSFWCIVIGKIDFSVFCWSKKVSLSNLEYVHARVMTIIKVHHHQI